MENEQGNQTANSSLNQSKSNISLMDFVIKIIGKFIPAHWLGYKFENLDKESKAFLISEKVKQWDFQYPPIISLLSQNNGCGKTHIAVCLFKKYIYDNLVNQIKIIQENGGETSQDNLIIPKVNFLSEKKLILEVQDSFNDKTTSEKEILDYYCNMDLLIIDDLLSSRENEFARRILFYIIDERVEWKRKPTVITSNYSLESISKIDSRISSRLENSMCFEITGIQKNYRK